MEEKIKIVAVSPDNWRTIVEYLLQAKVSTRRAKEAVEVLKAIESVQWLEIPVKNE